MQKSTQITFGLFDVTAKPDSTPSSNSIQSFCNINELKSNIEPKKYISLENNLWQLDGSFIPLQDTPSGIGLWSSYISDNTGTFANIPVLTVTFSGLHSSKGLSLTFSPTNDYASLINIKWYNGTTLLSQLLNHPVTGWEYSVTNEMLNYNKIVIEFLKTNKPNRYLKLSSIDFGITKIFSGDEVINASIVEEVDPLSAELSINTLNFTLHSKDAEFNILNPNGIYKLLQQRQPFTVRQNNNGLIKNMGTFYLDQWKNKTETQFDMSAIDAIGVMDKTMFMGGIYNSVTADSLVSSIMTSAGFTYTMESSLKGILISGYLPICTHREALQQVAFAIGAIISTSRTAEVIISVPKTTVTSKVDKCRKFMSGSSVELLPLVTGVDVIEHRYVASTETTEAFNNTLPVGTHEITFNEPLHTFTITGGTITKQNANAVTVNVPTQGTVVINAKKYIDNTRVVSKRMANIPAGEKQNILRVEDATLVSSINSSTVVERVYNYYQKRLKQTFSMTLEDEKAGDFVAVDTMYNLVKNGTITENSINLTGGFRSKVVVIGE